MEITSVFSLIGICCFTLFLLYLVSLISVCIYVKTVSVESMNLSTFPSVKHVMVLLIILTKISVYNFLCAEKTHNKGMPPIQWNEITGVYTVTFHP
jgi:hypothetical protein